MTDQQQSRQLTPAQEIRHTLDRMAPQFQAALPAHIPPEKFIRVAATAIQTNPDLQQADRTSLYAACTRAAQDGLLPDGREAALVIFKTNVGTKENPRWVQAAQYMPMIAGILKKIRNSGELSSITAQVIHQKDRFKYWVDSDGEHLEFEPDMLAERGPIIGVFAMAKLTDGALYVEVMTNAQVEQVRAVSRAGKSGPWVQWWDEMARKTVMRRLAKRLPMSTDIDGMFPEGPDERVVAADVQPMTDVTPEPEPEPEKKPRQSRARAAVEQRAPEPEPSGPVIDHDPGDTGGGDPRDGEEPPVGENEIPI